MSVIREIDIDDERFRIKPFQQMIAACSGALITSLFMTPLDVVKIRIQTQQKKLLSNRCYVYCNGLMDHLCVCSPEKGPFGSYNLNKPSVHFNGTLDAFVKISRAEGVGALWSGLAPTIILAVPATVAYFVSYEQLRLRIRDAYNKRYRPNQTFVQPIWIPLFSGGIARIIASSLVSPVELIRTKVQSQGLSYLEHYNSLKTLVKDKGISALWRGLGSTLLRDVPFSAIYWSSYETIKAIWGDGEQPSFLFSFLAGAASGSMAAVFTLPFDVVKTHQQIDFGEKELMSNTSSRSARTRDIIFKIYHNRGIKGLFSGLTPRLIKVAPACAIMISSYEYGKSFFWNYNVKKYTENIGNYYS